MSKIRKLCSSYDSICLQHHSDQYFNLNISFQTEDQVPSNTLLEVMVNKLPSEDCDTFYASNPFLPNGMHESQICVKSVANNFASEAFYPNSW